MTPESLMALDLERLKRLKAGEVTIVDHEEGQATYQILLKKQEPTEIVRVTGLVQTIFGARLLSSGSHQDPDGFKVEARVDIANHNLSVNEPQNVEVQVNSFLMRARAKRC